MKMKVFWIFGMLQSLSLAAIIFLLFRGFRMTGGKEIIGMDTQCVLSAAFPLFLLLTEAAIFYGGQKKNL